MLFFFPFLYSFGSWLTFLTSFNKKPKPQENLKSTKAGHYQFLPMSIGEFRRSRIIL